jgi:hypothetical protein
MLVNWVLLQHRSPDWREVRRKIESHQILRKLDSPSEIQTYMKKGYETRNLHETKKRRGENKRKESYSTDL